MATAPAEVRVAFTGGRAWRDESSVRAVVDRLDPASALVLVGDCPTGLDALVRRLASARQLNVRVYEADWRREGRSAGPKRNERMLRDRPSVLYAFLDDTGPHPNAGTLGCMRLAARLGVRVVTAKASDLSAQ